MSGEYRGKGIVATKDDVGRRVRLPIWGAPTMVGTIVRVRRCRNRGTPVAIVHYEGEAYPVATYQAALEWEDAQADLL